ncbi:MAG: LysR family transcriptional regulator [Marinobacter sp.]|nr:LysR family transcriptional regulator [Marinobacter sp.]
MYDLKELGAFAAILSYGSLTAAARHLGLPKSTLSRRLRQLELQLGQPLLRRESNRLIATEAGQVFADYCDQLLALAKRSQQALEEVQADISGELQLAFHSGFTRGWLTQLVEAFMSQYPRIRVHMQTLMQPPVQQDGEQIALWLGSLADNGLKQVQLGTLTQGLYASEHYLLTHGIPGHPRELAEHEWIDLIGNSNHNIPFYHGNGETYHFEAGPSRLRVDQWVVQGDVISAGRGLGLLPHWLANLRLQAHPGTLVPCLPDWRGTALPVWLLHPHGHLSRRSRAFMAFLQAHLPEEWAQTNCRRDRLHSHAGRLTTACQ